MTTLLTGLLGSGPAASVTHLVPDLHHFRGSFGGKDVIPLWRDADAAQPNITGGVLEALSQTFQIDLSPEELFAYCYAVLSAPEYNERFAEELEVPGPRIPLTMDTNLFRDTVALGEKLIWLHTYGTRMVPEGLRAGEVPQGKARSVRAVGGTPESYPTSHGYDETHQELHVGDGVFAPVAGEVRSYSVSGLDVVGSWLDYRMKTGAGKQSSPLDHIRLDVWPASFTEELLELIWVLEHTVAMAPGLNRALTEITAGATIDDTGLPSPAEEERAPPTD